MWVSYCINEMSFYDQRRSVKMGATEGGVVSSRPQPTTSEVLSKAANRALGGGASGAAAMGIQVTTLMWMRTTMNYQYRYGTSTTEALRLVVLKRVHHETYDTY